MKARGPIPRTEADRQARRDKKKKSSRSLLNPVPEVVMHALVAVRRSLSCEPRSVVQGLAYVCWIAENKARQHKEFDGWYSLNHLELEARFGQGKFAKLNDKHQILEVRKGTPAQTTNGYRLLPDIAEALRSHLLNLNASPAALTKWVGPAGRAMYRPPRLSSPKVLRKLPALLKDKPLVLEYTPVDLAALARLDAQLACAERVSGPQRDQLLSMLGLGREIDLRRLRSILNRVRTSARLDLVGRGRIAHEYVQCDTGRLFATGVSLQSSPKLIKRVALHGYYEYDIENCHPSFFEALAGHAGVDCPMVRYYLTHKVAVRQEVSGRLGITVQQFKDCLLALTYGAAASLRSENNIPKEIGVDKAREFFRDPFVAAFKQELMAGRKAILKRWPQKGGQIFNALGLPISTKAKASERLAHLLQGIEAQALLAIVAKYHGQILLLEHDGFVSRSPLDRHDVERLVYEATGFSLQFKCELIELPEALTSRTSEYGYESTKTGVPDDFSASGHVI